jgi:predicted nuclease of predicted toxin-antitoxin system
VIWNHALGIDAIIVTKDENFAERTARTAVGPVIVWLRIGNATNRALLEWLEPRWYSVVQAEVSGSTEGMDQNQMMTPHCII